MTNDKIAENEKIPAKGAKKAAPKKKAPAKKAPAKKAAAKKAPAKKKAKKDPNAPKRALSAYMFFASAKRAEIKEANPELSFGELGKKIGEMWRGLDDDEKAPYNEKAKADKARYAEEKAAYEAKKADEEEPEPEEEEEEDEDEDDE